MPGEDVTLGEVGRNVKDVKNSVSQLSGEVHAFQIGLTELRVDVRENTKDIAELQAEWKADASRRATDRRLIFAAIVAPIVIIIIQVLLNAVGVL